MLVRSLSLQKSPNSVDTIFKREKYNSDDLKSSIFLVFFQAKVVQSRTDRPFLYAKDFLDIEQI